MLRKLFSLNNQPIHLRKEIIAGITTFMTMAYILALNPAILGDAGMDKGAVFTATAVAAALATLVMAFWAKLPFALAPGMGLNAFFAYTVVIQMGYSWQIALAAVFIEGIIFILLTIANVREAIINSIPLNLKYGISAGIGLFIAFLGLKNAGIIISSNTNALVTLGDFGNPLVMLSLFGLAITGILIVLKVKGALLLGIITTTIVGIILGLTPIPEKGLKGLMDIPPTVSPTFLKFDFSQLFSLKMGIILFTFLFIDMFDTVGTLVGVCAKAGMLKDNKVPRAKQALFADAIGTTIGAALGTSTVTTYVESASGIAEGGRTGLTAVTVAFLFILSLFLAPLFLLIPSTATAPALVMVGMYMLSPIKKVNLESYEDAIPVFLTILIMPLTSISDGLVFGVLSYVIIKVFTGKFKDVSILMYILCIFFILKFVIK